jgi:hypothetical protein
MSDPAEIAPPDPLLHKRISFVKSALRIIAAGCLAYGQLVYAGGFFIIAEALGILEEMV